MPFVLTILSSQLYRRVGVTATLICSSSWIHTNVCCFTHTHTYHSHIDNQTHSGWHVCSFFTYASALSLFLWKHIEFNDMLSTLLKSWNSLLVESLSRKLYTFVPRIAKKRVQSVTLKRHAFTCASTSKKRFCGTQCTCASNTFSEHEYSKKN